MTDFKFDEEVYKLIIEQLDGAVVTDKYGRYVYVTKSWEDYYGKKLEDVKGKFVRDILPTTRINEALETGKPVIGHPIPIVNEKQEQGFCNYIPIIKNEEVVAGFIYLIFRGAKEAVDFSKILNNMLEELNYYQQELKELRKAKYSIDNIIGTSHVAMDLKDQIRRAAKSISTVLIEGETGSGKELVAHAIHDLSKRTLKPFVKINCAAIPADLFESELFGYEYGAFTGAKKEGKKGKFEIASGGSLFLDEINQMSLTSQPKLLRVLQEKEIEKIGGKGSIPIDVRLIAATNNSLEKLVSEKKFRNDLFYRLNIVNIRIPPLRERKEDISMLVDYIIDKLNFQLGLSIEGIENNVIDRFQEYEWPGNIRELQNVVERGMNMSLTGTLKWNDFKNYFENKFLKKSDVRVFHKDLAIKQAKKDVEKEIIVEVLKKYNNKTVCAKELSISRTMLYKKIKEYDIKQ